MHILWNKEIEDINKTGYLKDNISITDALIENFYNEILTKEEKALLKLVFQDEPSQEELDEVLKTWDIEVKGGHKSLLLAYLMKIHPCLKFSDYEKPRLKGLLNFFRFKNLKTISHYTKIGKALNNLGIEPLIIKGGAIKYLRPDLPRIMGDIDILVPEKDFLKSAQIATGVGYSYDKIDIHSIDLHEIGSDEGAIDLHRYILMDTGKEKAFLEGLFKRSGYKNVFGVQTHVPSNEDLLFITLVNLARNLREKTSQAGLLYALFDCKFLIESKSDFNWNIVRENAQKTGVEVQMNFVIKFIEKISKNVLPVEIQNNMLFEKETNEYSNMVMFNRFYLEEIRTKCRQMKISNIIKNPAEWKDYIFLKPKYMALKTLKKHPKLIELFIKDLRGKNAIQ